MYSVSTKPNLQVLSWPKKRMCTPVHTHRKYLLECCLNKTNSYFRRKMWFFPESLTHLAVMRFSLSESVPLCFLLSRTRKFSFWKVSHFTSLLASLPFKCTSIIKEKCTQLFLLSITFHLQQISLLNCNCFLTLPNRWILVDDNLRKFLLIKMLMWDRMMKGGARVGRKWYSTIRLYRWNFQYVSLRSWTLEKV